MAKDDICEEFCRMIEEGMTGRINMVITKSISRFVRNIPLLLEKENINTMDSKGNVLLTIMTSLAQQER